MLDNGRTTRYPWVRYWLEGDRATDSGGFGSIGHEGSRSSGLLNGDDPLLVLLGEPGMGKSAAIDDAVQAAATAGIDHLRVNLGAWDDGPSLTGQITDSPAWQSWSESTTTTLHLYLDGLDEAFLNVRAVDKRLLETFRNVPPESRARLRLRISCRSAEWPRSLEQGLSEIGMKPRRLRLAPLQRSDVVLAAEADGIDAADFLKRIERQDLTALAASPLTLLMLLDAAAEQGMLPESHRSLFDRACIRLIDEPDESRRRDSVDGSLHVGQRLAVAERVAAAMIFSGSAAATTDRTARGVAVAARQIAGFTEQDPDASGDADFEVTPDAIDEVLRTAFFRDLGGQRFGFWHRALAEFLAAKYVVRRRLSLQQVMSLVAVTDASGSHLIPQLREVTAWIATKHAGVLNEVVEREPDVLLRNGAVMDLPPGSHASVVARLLSNELAHRVARWDHRMRDAYPRLVHDGLAAQLREAMSGGHSLEIRQAALTLAHASRLPDLQDDLVELALNSEEPAYLRDDAVWALQDFADQETRKRLVPLALDWLEDDQDDEIKGQALLATFPTVLSAVEVFPALTPRRNPNLIGAYSMFLSELGSAMTVDALAVGLKWVSGQAADDEDQRFPDDLAESILKLAWAHSDDSAIADELVEFVLRRAAGHDRLLGVADEDAFPDWEGRRALVARAVTHGGGVDDFLRFYWTEPRLVVADDLAWLFDQLEAAVGTQEEPLWAAMASYGCVYEPWVVNRIYPLIEKSELIRRELGYVLGPIDLDSQTARNYAWRQERQQREQTIADEDAARKTQLYVALDQADEGAAGAWRVAVEALEGRTASARLEADLTRLPAWAGLNNETRARLVNSARNYLDATDPQPGEWFGTRTIYNSATAGYRALYLLAQLAPEKLAELPGDVWSRWLPVVIHFPRTLGSDGGEGIHDVLTRTASNAAPNEFAKWLIVAVDAQNVESNGSLYVLWRLRSVNHDVVVTALNEKLADPELTSQARADLLEFLLHRDPDGALVHAARFVDLRRGSESEEDAKCIGPVLFEHSPSRAWTLLKPMFLARPEVGEDIICSVAHAERRSVALLLDSGALEELTSWLFEHLPPDSDPTVEAGGHVVSERESAAELRSQLVAVLAERGTDESYTAVEKLHKKHPNAVSIRMLRAAREARLDRWSRPAPGDVVRLAMSNDARIVLSADHLYEAVIASLKRIGLELQAGQPPTAHELWNLNPSRRPKHEEQLSTWLAAKLKSDLTVGGRLIDREPEVRPNETGKGRGKSIDIAVSTPIGPRVATAETATIRIEVKGTWHPEVKTALEGQLVAEYLTPATPHGIYAVFWFPRTDWDPDDWRQAKWTKGIEETAALFRGQADDVGTRGQVRVSTIVFDGSLAPDG